MQMYAAANGLAAAAAAAAGNHNHLSKVLYIVTLYRKYTEAQTFEIFFFVPAPAAGEAGK